MIRKNSVNTPLLAPVRDVRQGAKYVAKLANGRKEILSALRLRYEVFHDELGCGKTNSDRIDLDDFDMRSLHLIVVENQTGSTIGTYRLGNLPRTRSISDLYCSQEFDLSQLPGDWFDNGIEVGRACIARPHRNSRVLLKLWQGMIRILSSANKRYMFGCCSMFTDDISAGASTYNWLDENGYVDKVFRAEPRDPATAIDLRLGAASRMNVPLLLEMYLRCGAKVCSPPILDREFGSIDMLIIFDLEKMPEKQRRMFERD